MTVGFKCRHAGQSNGALPMSCVAPQRIARCQSPYSINLTNRPIRAVTLPSRRNQVLDFSNSKRPTSLDYRG